MNNNLEIERKFLLKELPKLEQCRPTSIGATQGYICVTPDKSARLTHKDGKYKLTYKGGTDPLERVEIEQEISKEMYDILWPKTEGARIEKTRYYYKYEFKSKPIIMSDGRSGFYSSIFLIEVDVFHGKHEGLIVAEIEFASRAEALNFEPPDWFGEEVTNDPKYLNANLAS